ncbi:hypothetical protein AB0I55_18980 [Actinocatenispora sera]|uniref:hypothetical protein n=1 Tax=Actinocatenispora sera TaxID=390989 RepID=UPI003404227C
MRVAQLLTGAVLLVVPALFGPASGRLLLITGALTLVLPVPGSVLLFAVGAAALAVAGWFALAP